MAPLGAAGLRAGRGADTVGDRAPRGPTRRRAPGRGEMRPGPQMRGGAGHHHDDDYCPADHDESLAGCLRVCGWPVGQRRMHHYDDDYHDDDYCPADHDESLAGCLRVCGWPVGQRRMHHYDDDYHDDDYHHDDYHHDHVAAASYDDCVV